MSFIRETLESVPLPRVVKVKQIFEGITVENVEQQTVELIRQTKGYKNLKANQRIAITAGSRMFDHVVDVTRGTIKAIKEKGAIPFIVPAMGSHGGATDEGQKAFLAGIGITEETMGVPIISSMQVDLLGYILNDRPVYLDHNANMADGIVPINRIKTHTSFSGPYESGLMKMLTIGLGKQIGAQYYHQLGVEYMAEVVDTVGKEIIRQKNVVFGVGIIENSYGKIGEIHALDCNEIIEKEPDLLRKSKNLFPKLFCRKLDVLSIQRIGKNISGTGMDFNTVGRFYNPKTKESDVQITRIALLDMTDESHGNATGIGLADVVTKRLFDKVIFEQFYPNALTSTATEAVRIPMVINTDKMALQAAIKSCRIFDQSKVRMALIENTKNVHVFYISENLVQEIGQNKIEILSSPMTIPFDEDESMTLNYNE